MTNVKIVKTEIFSENAIVIESPEQNVIGDYRLADNQIQFTVKADGKEYLIVFQSEDPSCITGNTCCHGMTTALKFGVDLDQSDELTEYLDYDETFVYSLEKIADNLAKDLYNELVLESDEISNDEIVE